jgi:hypothetical protein
VAETLTFNFDPSSRIFLKLSVDLKLHTSYPDDASDAN